MVLLASARAVAAVQVGAGNGKVIGAQQGAGRGIPSAEGGRSNDRLSIVIMIAEG